MKKRAKRFSILALIVIALVVAWGSGVFTRVPDIVIEPTLLRNGKVVHAVRLGDGKPLITKEMFARLGVALEGENINGPSVIRVPDWIPANERPDASARYYMYFARHERDRVGDYIRMAWAERIEGPWRLFNVGREVAPGKRGVLDLGSDGTVKVGVNAYLANSVGSPDVIVDHERRRIIMYFHGVLAKREVAAFVSTSPFGLDFNGAFRRAAGGHGIRPTPLGKPYFRTFESGGREYAFTNFGYLHRSPPMGDPDDPDRLWKQRWERIDGPIRSAHNGTDDGDGDAREHPDNPRHFAVASAHGELWVFYTRRHDTPERILLSLIKLGEPDWRSWKATFPPVPILAPELDWEGGDLPFRESRNGKATNERALRDPYVLIDADGSWYLFYTGRGEEAIGVARLVIRDA